MQTKIIFSSLVMLALAMGCTGPDYSSKAIKMQQSSGKVGHATVGWFAECKSETPGGHEGVWRGPLQPEKEQAMQDAAEHLKQYPGHHVTIEHR